MRGRRGRPRGRSQGAGTISFGRMTVEVKREGGTSKSDGLRSTANPLSKRGGGLGPMGDRNASPEGPTLPPCLRRGFAVAFGRCRRDLFHFTAAGVAAYGAVPWFQVLAALTGRAASAGRGRSRSGPTRRATSRRVCATLWGSTTPSIGRPGRAGRSRWAPKWTAPVAGRFGRPGRRPRCPAEPRRPPRCRTSRPAGRAAGFICSAACTR